MKQKRKLLIYSHDKAFFNQLEELFSSHDDIKLIHASELRDAFELLSEQPFESLIFETYQKIENNFIGVNETDLDLLIYYANSNDSINRYMTILPINYNQETKENTRNIAENYYHALYEKYLLLLPSTTLEQFTIDSLTLSEEKKVLFDLINTFDSACNHLDEQIIDTDSHTIDSSQQSSDVTKIAGQREDLSQGIYKVSGMKEEAEVDHTRVSGQKEIHNDESTVVTGSKEKIKDEVSIVGSTEHNEKEAVTIIEGSKDSKEEQEEEKVVIKGCIEEDDSVTIIKGHKGHSEKKSSDIMKVKSLGQDDNPLNNDLNEEDALRNNINYRNSNGQTPLMILCHKGEREKAMELIDKGADTSLICKKGLSVLHYACAHPDNLRLVEYLVLVEKAKITARDNNGYDPLSMALKCDGEKVVQWLINQGARTNLKIKGQPLLHFAAQCNSFKSFLVLLSSGVVLNLKNDEGLTAQQYCQRKKKLPFLKALKAYSLLNSKKTAA